MSLRTKTNNFQLWFLCAFLLQENIKKINTFNPRKTQYLSRDESFMRNVVNRALPFLHGGSINITLTDPVNSPVRTF